MITPQEIELGAYIEASPARVFEALSDYTHFFRGGSIKYCRVTPSPVPPAMGLGAIRELQNGGVHFVEEITAFVPHQRIDYLVKQCSVPLKHEGGSTLLTPHGGGTEVLWTSRFVVPIPLFSKAATKFFGVLLVSELTRLLMQMKHELEA